MLDLPGDSADAACALASPLALPPEEVKAPLRRRLVQIAKPHAAVSGYRQGPSQAREGGLDRAQNSQPARIAGGVSACGMDAQVADAIRYA